MKIYLLRFFFFASLILVYSCNELGGFDDPIDTKREIAVPLFQSTTSLTKLLDGFSEETFVTVGPEDLITLNYKGDVTKRTADELFDFIESIVVPLEDSVTTFPFDLPGTLDVTLMRIKVGQLGLQFNNNLDEKVDVTLTIPELTKNGAPFMQQSSIDVGDEWFKFIGLSDYELQSDSNELNIIYEAYRESNGERVVFDNQPGIGILNLEFSYIEGYWGQEPLDLARDTIEIEFFEKWVQGDVFFEDPTIEIKVDNAFGFPVRSQVNTLNILTVDDQVISLESDYINDGIDFDYPGINEVGAMKTTVFDFDKNNSNVVDVLSSGPVSVDYDVDAISNPDMIQEIGFMTDTSYFNVQVSVELPFRGRVNDFKARDVFNVNLDSYDRVDYVEFKMIAENEIPLGIDIQIFFADENEVIFDSLYVNSENIIAPAPVDSGGEATGEVTEKTTFTTIDAAQFDRIKDAKKLVVEGIFSTSGINNAGASVVNLKSDQEVQIRMGMKVGTN